MKNSNFICRISFLAIIFLFTLAGCGRPVTPASEGKSAGQDCGANSECASRVCNFMKQDIGRCAPLKCKTGQQASGLSDIAFFCGRDSKWQAIRQVGEKCSFNYECFKATGKDCPTCHPGDYKYYCKEGFCVAEKQLNACEEQGLKRIVSKEDADSQNDGSCVPSMAQRPEITVCAPCGNGVCDAELESKCNCPEDCK